MSQWEGEVGRRNELVYDGRRKSCQKGSLCKEVQELSYWAEHMSLRSSLCLSVCPPVSLPVCCCTYHANLGHTHSCKKRKNKICTHYIQFVEYQMPLYESLYQATCIVIPPQYIVNWAKFSRSREPENARTLTRHGIWVYELVNVLIRCVTNL